MVGVGVGSAKQPDESQTSMSSLGENPPAGVGWGVMTTLARRQLSPSLLPAQKSKLHGAFANSHTLSGFFCWRMRYFPDCAGCND